MQGSWKRIVTKLLTSWKKCGGKLEKVCADVPKKPRASQVQFRAMRRKSLYKCTENEEAGKAQNCAGMQRNTHNICIKVQKIIGN